MNAPAYPAGSRRPWRGWLVLAGAILLGLGAATVLAPSAVFAPLRDLAGVQAPVGRAAGGPDQPAVRPGRRPGRHDRAGGAGGAPAASTAAPASAAAPPGAAKPGNAGAVANQSDPEPGIVLITAVYNSIQDRFFRPLDSRDLLGAAWEGARRALAEQRRPPGSIAPPALTGDRAGDLEAFVTQYRALVGAAGSGVDLTRVAMATSDIMTQSVGEQHTVFLARRTRSRASAPA